MMSANTSQYGRLDPMSHVGMSQEDMLQSLEALVRAESPSSDLVACQRVLEVAADIADRELTTPATIEEIGGRPLFWWGSKNPRIVILAHLDTVWPIGGYQPLWSVEGDVIRGPGVFDMKAGFIQALYALKDLPGGSDHVALIATTDEETGSATSKNLIKEVSAKAEAVLVLEASLDGKVKTGRKGTAMYQVVVHGRASHAGLEPEKGINATTEIAHIVLALLALENPEHGTTVVPTTMQSGTSTNSVPDYARLDIDVRSFATDDLQRIDSAVRALKPTVYGATLEITGSINRPPLQPESTKELYLVAEKVAAEIGIPPLGSAIVGGASDGNFAAAAGAKVLDGLGAVGGGAHASHEWVSLKTLQPRSDFLNALLKELIK
jgi:glutamate carboxypeptidase